MRARVLIVAKTRMNNDRVCIGGMAHQTHQSLRLLQSDGNNHPQSVNFEVGDIWDLEFRLRQNPRPPHIEDALVTKKQRAGRIRDLRQFLVGVTTPWKGSPDQLFDGLIAFTSGGSGYISENTGLPNTSTGYWIPNRPLTLTTHYEKFRYEYSYPNGRTIHISFVGITEPVQQIESETLVRVSLARWWHPDDSPDMEDRCYLQLSGWYL